MKNILITGAAGFLGSHIAMYHLRRGDKVFGVDNFSTTFDSDDNRHLAELLKNDNFYFEKLDVCHARPTSYEFFLNKADSHKFDVIYNAACPASPPRYQALAVETLLTCTTGVKNLLDLARLHKSTLIQFSTSEVYGDPEFSPQNESYWGNVNSYGERSMYDEGKRCAEAFCWVYHRQFNVDIRVIRIFNTYGPHMDPDDGRVVTNFIKQALKNENITVFGDGKQTRSFCYVDDLVSAITGIADLSYNPGKPINIGNPHEFTMLELAEKVKQHIPASKSKIIFKPLPGDDPKQRRPDISFVKRLLPWWEPQFSLDEGLKRMIPYMESVTL